MHPLHAAAHPLEAIHAHFHVCRLGISCVMFHADYRLLAAHADGFMLCSPELAILLEQLGHHQGEELACQAVG